MAFPCPIKFYEPSMARDILMTPAAFRRIWFHTTTTKVKSVICSTGWNPEKIKSSMYGSAVYLARKKWDPDNTLADLLGPPDRDTLMENLRSPKMIACVLTLQTDEVMTSFPSEHAPNGKTEQELLNYLSEKVPRDEGVPGGGLRRVGIDGSSTNLRYGRNPVSGDHKKNKEIARYFLSNGIKAVRFFEQREEVVAVFDPGCIRVLPRSTNFDAHPFSDILASNDAAPIV